MLGRKQHFCFIVKCSTNSTSQSLFDWVVPFRHQWFAMSSMFRCNRPTFLFHGCDLWSWWGMLNGVPVMLCFCRWGMLNGVPVVLCFCRWGMLNGVPVMLCFVSMRHVKSVPVMLCFCRWGMLNRFLLCCVLCRWGMLNRFLLCCVFVNEVC